MSRRLLISALPGETRAARLAGDELVALLVERADRPTLADNLYLGRVTALNRDLGAAFVDIGRERPGFLPLDEAPAGLSEGAALVVRVKREPSMEKAARLTALLGRLPPEVAALAERAAPPALLRRADPLEQVLGAAEDLDEIVVDDPACFAALRRRLAEQGAGPSNLRLDLEPVPLFERAGVEEQLEALLEPQVALPSGGALLIEPVTTLTAIDVNAGRHAAAAGPDHALAVDLEAAAEIARQVRLRALSGLIVIDFLELAEASSRRRVVQALAAGLAADPVPHQISALRRSGLLEMTRRRARLPLHEVLCQPCGIGGGGRVHDPVTSAFAALRAARARAASAPASRGVTILAEPAVVAALDGVAAEARHQVAERLGRPLRVRAQAGHGKAEILLE